MANAETPILAYGCKQSWKEGVLRTLSNFPTAPTSHHILADPRSMNLICRPGDSSSRPSGQPPPRPAPHVLLPAPSSELPLLLELLRLEGTAAPSLCRALNAWGSWSAGARGQAASLGQFRAVLGQVFIKLLHPHHHTHFINWGGGTEHRQCPGASLAAPASPELCPGPSRLLHAHLRAP